MQLQSDSSLSCQVAFLSCSILSRSLFSDHFGSVEEASKHLPVQVVAQVAPKGWDSFNEPSEVDPFDTSFADNCAPGKAELRLIEKEILAGPVVPSGKQSNVEWQILACVSKTSMLGCIR